MNHQVVPKALVILEVSQKQAYIFGDKQLKENVKRSKLIDWVTDPNFFIEIAAELFNTENNLVYAGGGHTILQFDQKEDALAFVRVVTRTAYLNYGIELFAKTMDYAVDLTPGENITELKKALEAKKSLRLSTFHQRGIGLEKETLRTFNLPTEDKREKKYPTKIERLCGAKDDGPKDNLYAVVHIDGNGMGAKVHAVTEKKVDNWEECRQNHRAFSDNVTKRFQETMNELVEKVEEWQKAGRFEKWLGYTKDSEQIPFRPVIQAGDDVTFLAPAFIALECAAEFLQILDKKTGNETESTKRYAACAGIVMVHKKYPFDRAYNMAEALCGSAKRYAAELAEKAKRAGKSQAEMERIAAMDWHIEFGQGKSTLSAIREDYFTVDSGDGETESSPIRRMNLRPLCVNGYVDTPFRTYDYFKCLLKLMEEAKYPRSKVKNLREVLKQTEDEVWNYMITNQIQSLSKLGFDAEDENAVHRTFVNKGREKQLSVILEERGEGGKTLYVCRSLYFDAIELMDRTILMEKGAEE